MTVIAAVFVMLAFSFAQATSERFMRDEMSEELTIALVSSDSEAELLTDFIESLSDVAEYARFETMDMSSAMLAMENGKAVAVLELPEGFMSSILSGENMSATLRFDGSDMFGLMVLYAGNCAGDMLIAVQSAIYAVLEQLMYADEFSASSVLMVNLEYIKFMATRANMYEQETVFATGALTLYEHYFASFIIFILLMCAPIFYSVFDDDFLWRRRLRAIGVSATTMAIANVCTVFICLLPLGFAVCAICGGLEFMAVLALVVSLCAFVVLLLTLSHSQSFCSGLSFLIVSAMAVCAGSVLPPILLPSALQNVLNYIPFDGMRQACYGYTSAEFLAVSAVCLVITTLVLALRYERQGR